MNIIDSSIALQWVLPEDGAADSESYYRSGDSRAPDIILVEVANVLAKKVRSSELTAGQAQTALTFVQRGLSALEPTLPLVERALEMSIALSHPVYDCVFLACAERLDGKLVTRDRPFVKRARERGFGSLLAGISS